MDLEFTPICTDVCSTLAPDVLVLQRAELIRAEAMNVTAQDCAMGGAQSRQRKPWWPKILIQGCLEITPEEWGIPINIPATEWMVQITETGHS